jgi:hypothetical protein
MPIDVNALLRLAQEESQKESSPLADGTGVFGARDSAR